MVFLYKKTFLLVILFFFSLVSANARLKVATWNMQTFFDANTSGTEYKEFLSDKYPWTEALYIKRCQKSAKIISEINADIIILEEIENETVLLDLYNQMSDYFFKNGNYKYATFAKEDGASIGIGVLSKNEIYNVKLHSSLVISRRKRSAPSRPIISFCVQDQNKELTIFANHWKSKLGGGKELRELQEKTLSFLSKNASTPVIALGDFNTDNSEFKKRDGFTDLKTFSNEYYALKSAWDSASIERGSYAYRGHWERIDNIFYSDKTVFIKDFSVFYTKALIDKNGFPHRYSIYSEEGYSDHLPVSAVLDL